MIASPKTLRAAAQHLSQVDPILAPVIQAVGDCRIEPHHAYYQELIESIIGQQLSILAAAAIRKRFVAAFDGQFPTPEQLLAADHNSLRSLGLSNAKARYIHDLAEHVYDGRLQFDDFDDLTNEEIIARCTAVKGIGEWTVHMFLIFCMGRLNVLPVGDLGIKNGMQKLYNLPQKPSSADMQHVASTHHWAPYESVASWYVWQSLKLSD